jgi:hypothetical protein
MSQPGPDRQQEPHDPQESLPAPPNTEDPPPTPPNGFGIAALVLAVIGLAFEIVPLSGFVSFISGTVGIVFGILGLLRDGRAIANLWVSGLGTALSLLALVLGIWGMAVTTQATNPATNPGDGTGPAGQR